jgi:long-chain acyl-CoA synthetase
VLYRWLQEVTEERGSAKALVYRDTYVSWRGLLHRVDRRAQELEAMGIGPGAWAGLMLGNVPDFVTLALALAKLDAVVVPLDPTTSTRELETVLETAPLRALITRPRGGESSALPGTPPGGTPAPSRGPTSARAKKVAPEARRRLQGTLLTCSLYPRRALEPPKEGRAVLYTSDSFGEPKGVIRTTAQLTATAEIIGRSLEVKPEEKILAAVPLYSAYGFDFGLLLALRYGLTLFLEDEVAPKRIAKVLREHSVEILPATPMIYAALAKLLTAKPLSKTKSPRFLAAGSPLVDGLADTFRTRYGVRLMSCYHTTEAGPVSFDQRAQTPKSVGKPFDEVEIEITDPQGDRLTGDKEGIVWVRSASSSAHYVGAAPAPPPAKTGRAAKESKGRTAVAVGYSDSRGWCRTGDIGWLDRAGRLFLGGREDDLVKVDGKRVALGEVEGCLESFPKVKQAQAVVITDPLVGPMVIARVVAAGRCEAEELIDHCAKNLAPYKVPRRIEFCDTLA